MRSASLLAVAVFLAACGASTAKPGAPVAADSAGTKFAHYAGRAGVLLTKDFRGVGTMVAGYDTITLTAARIRAAGVPVGAFALKLDCGSILGHAEGLVDLDELQAMDSAVGVLLHAPVPMDTNYVEMDFVTRGGVHVGIYRDGNGYRAFLRPTADLRAMVPLTIPQLSDLQAMLGRGIAALKGMGATL